MVGYFVFIVAIFTFEQKPHVKRMNIFHRNHIIDSRGERRYLWPARKGKEIVERGSKTLRSESF